MINLDAGSQVQRRVPNLYIPDTYNLHNNAKGG
jgi:hypothetical protein